MSRSLFVAAAPPLAASLKEQFEALGGYALRELGATPDFSPPWPDAALLDAAACDAAALAGKLRAEGFAGAIVVVGAQAPEADAVLTRPLRFADLLAALEATPKRPAAAPCVGARLTEKERAILDRLTQARGATIPKAVLLADVWGYGPNVSTRTLETHIHRLRRKIEADPDHPQKLLTEAGGYRLASFEEENGASLPSP